MAAQNIDTQRKNLMEYTLNAVTNKPVVKRIYHSSAQPMANIRRTAQAGSPLGAGMSKFGVKAVTTGIKSAAKRIPIPGVSTLVSQLTGSLESWWRSERDKRRHASAKITGDDTEILKFQIKDFSLPALDSYRQKLEVAARELNTQSVAFNTVDWPKYIDEHRVCDGHVKNFTALHQLVRRHNKLAEAVNECEALMSAIKGRLREVEKSVDFVEGRFWTAFEDDMASGERDASLHAHCAACTKQSIPLSASQRIGATVASNKIFSKLLVPMLGGYAQDLAYAKEGQAIEKGKVTAPS